MRWLSLGLALLLCCLSTSARGAPRQIRVSLDDVDTPPESSTQGSHANFTLTRDPQPRTSRGRLIRLSLDDGAVAYGHVGHAAAAGRRIRVTLD